MMRPAFALILAFACLGLLAACDDGADTPSTGQTPGATATAQTPTETPLDVCQPNPDPAPSDVTEVDSPAPGDGVTSPVTVSGRIVAFEAQFNITILDEAGDAIADVPAMSEEGQVLAPFSEDVAFSVTEETPACVWVYDVSEMDGVTPINVVQIPVTLLPGGEPAVCATNPDPATEEVQVIDQPSAGDTVTSPVTISGQVAAFEATFQITIYDASGASIADVRSMAAEGQVLSPFSEDVAFTVTEETPACIWVYEKSAQDGRPIHVGQIPVTLSP